MVAAGCIPKPTFWTFYFFKQLKLFGGECVYRDKDSVVVKRKDGYAGIIWNIDKDDRNAEYQLSGLEDCEYTLITKTVDEVTCNPLKLWHDMGEPAYPTESETAMIKSASWPQTLSEIKKPEDKKVSVSIPVRKNGVVFFNIVKRIYTPDRGYDYDKVISFH